MYASVSAVRRVAQKRSLAVHAEVVALLVGGLASEPRGGSRLAGGVPSPSATEA